MNRRCLLPMVLILGVMTAAGCGVGPSASDRDYWPAMTNECKPWTYWWWMASAVDEQNIRQELETFQKAGFGGVHIIPIYGAKGYQDRYIEYLSPRWMEILDYTVRQARQLGMDTDMTLGTGWCFGGPTITDLLANASLKHSVRTLEAGRTGIKPESARPLFWAAYDEKGVMIDLTPKISADGTADWTAPPGQWRLYELWQKPSGRMVKRAAPGGQGHMLNPFYNEAMRNYLGWFDQAFKDYKGLMPRAMYHDSYEYSGDWSPDFLKQFESRRGYRLQDHLPAFLGDGDSETMARLKGDYRRTLSDLMVENFGLWDAWSQQKGCITRNEAHGAPGNLLDLYALADVPETEFFRFDRNPLVAKFASSAAHVAGRVRTGSETGTWLKEHYHVSLGHLKNFIDGLFVSGINHMFYHGTCYSPQDAPWPGWVFYASTQMNPQNSIWHDVDALNGYLARCQSVLQEGRPDNDLLVYWPIHDLWHNQDGMNMDLTVHHTDWLTAQPAGTLAALLWKKGFAFDYISDLQLRNARVRGSQVEVSGGTYRAIVVPACTHMPADTLKALYTLAGQGAKVLFENDVPQDVPGLGDLEKYRVEVKSLNGSLKWNSSAEPVGVCMIGQGVFYRSGLTELMLEAAGVQRETMVDHRGLQYIRRRDDQGHWYFIINQDEQFTEDPNTVPFKGWMAIARAAESVVILDPMTGQSGMTSVRKVSGQTQVYMQLQPGQSLILRTFDKKQKDAEIWQWYQPGEGVELKGTWKVEFIEGGPELPESFTADKLQSWTTRGKKAECFAGTARYRLSFDAPAIKADAWQIDLGKVASSARVNLNGQEVGAAISVPYAVQVPADLVKAKGNKLQIEVTNLSANRIRDLDRRGVPWKYFTDINIVNVEYKKFDASQWEILDSGLLGPVKLIPLKSSTPK